MRSSAWLAGIALALAASPAWAQPQPSSEPPTRQPAFEPPVREYTVADPVPRPSFAWLALQLLPSPELAVGQDARHETAAAFGFRWQLTPVLYSWGLHRRVTRFRFFVVDPLARVSGSIALEQSFEYVFGHVGRVLVRPGVKATFPFIERGEYLAGSIGTSVYSYDSRARVAYDVGLYTLFGTLGAVVTYAPDHRALQSIATIRIRYF